MITKELIKKDNDNGILDKDKFVGHKESICGKYALRPSKGSGIKLSYLEVKFTIIEKNI